MGQNSSADLYWGFDLGMIDRRAWDRIKPLWMDETEEWREVYAIRMGWEPLPEPHWPKRDYRYDCKRWLAKEEEFRQTDEYQAWSARRYQLYVLTKDLLVELVTYGRNDEPSYCVQVRASVQQALDYGSTELEPLVVNPEWHDQVMRFMEHLELPIPEGKTPGWHLNCSYG